MNVPVEFHPVVDLWIGINLVCAGFGLWIAIEERENWFMDRHKVGILDPGNGKKMDLVHESVGTKGVMG